MLIHLKYILVLRSCRGAYTPQGCLLLLVSLFASLEGGPCSAAAANEIVRWGVSAAAGIIGVINNEGQSFRGPCS